MAICQFMNECGQLAVEGRVGKTVENVEKEIELRLTIFYVFRLLNLHFLLHIVFCIGKYVRI